MFDEERLALMRDALARLLATRRKARNARFVAQLRARDETVTIALADGAGTVTTSVDDAGPVDFSVSGPTEAWEGYFSGVGDVAHSSVLLMTMAADISGGVLTTSLTPEGDLIRLYANWPIVNRLLEAAAVTPGSPT